MKSGGKTNVYEKLEYAITNMIYKPGQELDINSIAEELDVSRSPVRDALLKLSMNKLIDIFPQKGTRVSLLDKKIIYQERFIRIQLELGVLPLCLETLVTQKQREAFVAKLQGTLLSQHASLLDDNKIQFLKYDDEMHHLFYKQADYEWAWETQIAHTGNDHRIRILSYNAEEIATKVEAEHELIVEAVRENNLEKLIEIDRTHLTRISEEIESLEASYPDYFSKERLQ